MDSDSQPTLNCANCGSEEVGRARVNCALWHDGRLVVVEDIPALVCARCNEQFYDDTAVVVLDLLRGDGFPAENARTEWRVPVFSFSDRLAPGPKT